MVSGALGWLPKEALNLAAHFSGLQKKRYGEVFAGLFVSEKKANSRAGIWFGDAADLVFSSLLGVLLAFVLSSTGKDQAPIKGSVVALLGFGSIRGLIANAGPNKVYPRDVLSNSYMTLSSITWGLATGFIMRALADDSILPEQRPGYIKVSIPQI